MEKDANFKISALFFIYQYYMLKCWTLNILHPDNLIKYKEFKEIQLLIESLCCF